MYDMQNRELAAIENREGIIQAAHELLNQPGGGSLALNEVAAAAGVSRATIYNRVGSRRDLLVAVFEDQGRLIRFDRVLRSLALADPAQAIVSTVRESCRAWAVMPIAIRRTLALAAVDSEVGELVHRYEGHRRKELASLARRARGARVLDPALSVADAAAVLTICTGFPAYDQLRMDLRPAEATRHMVKMASTALGLKRMPGGRHGK
jgi:AcrR family transcriptional regulator